jgi:hypothetical protein
MDVQLSFSSKLLLLLLSICLPQFLILIAQTEDTLIKDENLEISYERPLLSLSLCSIGFAALTFFASFNPDLIGANPISLAWIIGFAIFWSFSFSFGVAGTLPNLILCGFLFVESQRSTDKRGYWEKFFSPESHSYPQSLAMAVIGSIVLFLIFFGSLVGSEAMSSIDINRRWQLLLASSLLGIGLGGAAHLGFWVVRSISIG